MPDHVMAGSQSKAHTAGGSRLSLWSHLGLEVRDLAIGDGEGASLDLQVPLGCLCGHTSCLADHAAHPEERHPPVRHHCSHPHTKSCSATQCTPGHTKYLTQNTERARRRKIMLSV
ncbi:hypothetical protein E2C01_088009 [Portunus trituberculatus]|uniref:Uncharacterized protein n=1 Tax=Portunus trituberculatus TaxID=210409 RepID=A0A5B7JFK2_PORTR|nr:hypothetical protein [Portunus trituberculatus]